MAFHRLGINSIPAGPLSILFSILYQYYRLVPSAYTFQIFALRVTNKSFLYVLALQVRCFRRDRSSADTLMQCAISQLPGAAAAAAVGLLTGQLYRADMLGLKTYRLPPSVQRFGERFLLPLIGSTRPPRRSNQAMPEAVRRTEGVEPITAARPRPAATPSDGGSAEGSPNENGEPNGARAAGASVVREWMSELTGGTTAGIRVPTEAEISQVTSMFPDLPRQSVVGALQQSPNIERAVETLLGSST